MSVSEDFDQLLGERLRSDAPASPPGDLLEATLRRIEDTPQRAERRGSQTLIRILAAAAVIVLAVMVGTQLPGLLGPSGNDPSPTAVPTPTDTDGIVELSLDTPRRHCVGDADQLLSIYRIPNGQAFWTVFPYAGLAPELDEVEVPLLVVVYEGGWSTAPVDAPLVKSPAPGTVTVCVETVDGSEAIASSAFGVYPGIPLQPVANDWGPLAVVAATGDMALTQGTLNITNDCVFLEANGTLVLLVWPAEQTRWNAGTGTISFTTLAGDIRTLTTDDLLSLGGGGWSPTESGQNFREWAASVDWVNPPNDACLTDGAWFVTDVLPESSATPQPTPSPVAVNWHPIFTDAQITEYTVIQGSRHGAMA